MMVLRTGVDMSSVSALERRARRSRNDFIGRFWTERERTDCGDDYSRLAARWSAKEAAMKALEMGIGKIDPVDIEVVTEAGAPSLRFYGTAATQADHLGLNQWSVSLSHEQDLAIAIVVALGEK